MLTGRQVGSEYLAAARPPAGGIGAAEPGDGAVDRCPAWRGEPQDLVAGLGGQAARPDGIRFDKSRGEGSPIMAQNAPAEAAAVPAGPRREVLIILPGLLLAIMLAMLDQLVVSTALPRIVGDLGGVTHLAWVVTAYVLASTVTTPLYGKLGDLYGRKRLLMIAIVIFLIGSALSGLSHTMDQLIAFRALQGLGAGGLLVGAIATIGDLVSPRERGQYMGYIMAAMTLAMIAGPLVGGYITDNFSWRWIFYINMPIGGAALVYLAATMHLPRLRVQHKIDYAGAITLAIAATSIILMTTWGGTQYAWGSVQVIGLIVLAILRTAAVLAI